MRRIRMIDNWKEAWKWMSVNCMLLAGSIQATWMCIPDDMRTSVPPNIVQGLTIVILIMGIFGRLTKGRKK